MLKNFLTNFVKDEGGQSIVEYSLLLTLIGVLSAGALTMMGLRISTLFGRTEITAETFIQWAYRKGEIE